MLHKQPQIDKHPAPLRRVPAFYDLKAKRPVVHGHSQLYQTAQLQKKHIDPQCREVDFKSTSIIIPWIHVRGRSFPEELLDALSSLFASSHSIRSGIRNSAPVLAETPIQADSYSTKLLDPIRNIAVTDTTYIGNALFLHTEAFPKFTRDLRVGDCCFLNFTPDVRHKKHLGTSINLHVSRPPLEGSPPEFWLEMVTPALRASNGRKAWDIVSRLSLTNVVRGLLAKRIVSERSGEQIHKLLGREPSLDVWTTQDDAVDKIGATRPFSDLDVEGPNLGISFEQEADTIVKIALKAARQFRKFLVLVPSSTTGGWDIGFISSKFNRYDIFEGDFMEDLSKRLCTNEMKLKINLRFQDDRRGTMDIVKVTDGRKEGKCWWIAFFSSLDRRG